MSRHGSVDIASGKMQDLVDDARSVWRWVLLDAGQFFNAFSTHSGYVYVYLGVLCAGVVAGLLLFRTLRRQSIVHMNTKSKLNQLLLPRMKEAQFYKPPFLMSSPHVQSFATSVLRERPQMSFARHPLHLDDGGCVSLDWYNEAKVGTPCLILLHGLTGGSQEKYIRWMVSSAANAGYTAVVMNARGCSRNALLTPQSMSAAWTKDIRETVRLVREKIGQATPLFAVGYSLGAGILTKYVCEEGSACPLDAAISCCASFDLDLSTSTMERSFMGRMYNKVLAKSLAKYLALHEHHFAPGAAGHGKVDIAAARTAQGVRQFDTAAIVPQFGYKTVEDYYKDGSTAHRIHGIGIPYLALNALDDPICATAGLPAASFQANPHTISIVTDYGSHVAWLDAPTGIVPRLTTSWDNRVVVQYMQAICSLIASDPSLFPARQERLQHRLKHKGEQEAARKTQKRKGSVVADDDGNTAGHESIQPHLEA